MIHAGLSMEDNKRFQKYNLNYPKGYIIGEAEIVDCTLVDKELDEKLRQDNYLIYGHNHIGVYAWKLVNIVKYDQPIEAKGKLGLWNYEKTTI